MVVFTRDRARAVAACPSWVPGRAGDRARPARGPTTECSPDSRTAGAAAIHAIHSRGTETAGEPCASSAAARTRCAPGSGARSRWRRPGKVPARRASDDRCVTPGLCESLEDSWGRVKWAWRSPDLRWCSRRRTLERWAAPDGQCREAHEGHHGEHEEPRRARRGVFVRANRRARAAGSAEAVLPTGPGTRAASIPAAARERLRDQTDEREGRAFETVSPARRAIGHAPPLRFPERGAGRPRRPGRTSPRCRASAG